MDFYSEPVLNKNPNNNIKKENMNMKLNFSDHLSVPKYVKILTPFADKDSYHEFSSIIEAKDWAEEHYSDWEKNYKETIAASARYPESSPLHFPDSMDMYFGYRYRQINEYLRGNDLVMDSNQDSLNESNYALRRDLLIMSISILSAPVIKDKIILYRQVPEDIFRQLMDDGSYVESGFMSTSLEKMTCAEACGSNSYILKLYVDTVRPIHSVYANLVRERDEMELLLQPELKLRVISQPYLDNDAKKIVCDTFLMNAAYSNGCKSPA